MIEILLHSAKQVLQTGNWTQYRHTILNRYPDESWAAFIRRVREKFPTEKAYAWNDVINDFIEVEPLN